MRAGMVDNNGWLIPYDGAKSFYGKARVVKSNGVMVLVSYSTVVAVWKGGKMHRTWAGWSATTARHINAFCQWCGVEPMRKKEWEALPYEDRYTLMV